ncbi:MAG TPA: bifunctional glutamate N-acetyltransferase/amino-acid acetyltransferase ArgJ [Anaeromyxobacteraceae bacterium]|nr:bifunctional glutamate N-acetyltransferase/amino-acid acetyltransferase ArgJ [Anaeromyxobacteraceae bacterium]
MPSTSLTFRTRDEHRAWLAAQSRLPRGFRAGAAAFEFTPFEVEKPARMKLTLLALDRPTEAFAAVFTRNAFPGAPVVVGRRRLAEPRLGAVLVNNKISNVCAPGGVEASERLCAAAAAALGLAPSEVLPSSTGVIGWRLPVDAMAAALPRAVAALQADSILPAADGIMTTDLYPKVRRADLPGGGSVVGIAKGAGMIEPNLATMLAYLLTDAEVPREVLRAELAAAVDESFNAISIDSDTSTSDTVALLASGAAGPVDLAAFRAGLRRVCRDLAEDVVRNGEGVRHVLRVKVAGAPDAAAARALGKAVVNSPLLKTAVAGNDPNVGRLVAALGKEAGARGIPLDPARARLSLGGELIVEGGLFRLDREKERRLTAHLVAAELYPQVPAPDGITFKPPVDFPAHERCVEVEIQVGDGPGVAEVLGADLTHEYVTENADYRS